MSFTKWTPGAPIYVVVRRWPDTPPAYLTPGHAPNDETPNKADAVQFYARNEALVSARAWGGKLEPVNAAAHELEAELHALEPEAVPEPEASEAVVEGTPTPAARRRPRAAKKTAEPPAAEDLEAELAAATGGGAAAPEGGAPTTLTVQVVRPVVAGSA